MILGPDGKPVSQKPTEKEDEFTALELYFEQSLDRVQACVQVFANLQGDEKLPENWANDFIDALSHFRNATQALVVDRNDKMIQMAQKLRDAADLIVQLRGINARLAARNN